jgi:hypothetical protein
VAVVTGLGAGGGGVAARTGAGDAAGFGAGAAGGSSADFAGSPAESAGEGVLSVGSMFSGSTEGAGGGVSTREGADVPSDVAGAALGSGDAKGLAKSSGPTLVAPASSSPKGADTPSRCER